LTLERALDDEKEARRELTDIVSAVRAIANAVTQGGREAGVRDY
jgi:hypothetical protein